MCTTITFCNQKGGACKTTATAAFASYLTSINKRVLCVDVDQQASLSFLLGANKSHAGAFELFTQAMNRKDLDTSDFIQTTSVSDLIQATDMLGAVEVMLKEQVARESILNRTLESVKPNYDYILIDTPPALSVLMINALVAADYVVIPTNSNVLHAHGMNALLNTITIVKDQVNPNLSVAGILLTMVRPVKAHAETEDLLKTIASKYDFEVPVFEHKVRLSVAVENAQRMGYGLFDPEISNTLKHSPAILDYAAVVEEFLASKN